MKRILLKFLIGALIIPLYLWGTVTNSGAGNGVNTSSPYVDNINITVTAGIPEEINMRPFYHNFPMGRTPNKIETYTNKPGFVSIDDEGRNYKITISAQATDVGGSPYAFGWKAKHTGAPGYIASNNRGTINIIVRPAITSPTVTPIDLGDINENTNETIEISSHLRQKTYPIDHIVITDDVHNLFTENLHGDYKKLFVQSPDVGANTSYTVHYKACDDHSNCSSESTISFMAINKTPPQTQNLSFSYEKDSGTKTINNMKNRAIKTQSDSINDISLSSTFNFITLDGAHNTISVDTDAAPAGTYTVTWQAEDIDGWSTNSENTITITITTAVITAPHADDISITVDEGKSTTKHMWEGITVHTNPIKTINFRGTIPRYMALPSTNITAICDATASPGPDDQGTKSFLWQVCDNATPSNCSNWASFTVTVNDVPPPSAGGYDIYMEKGTTLKDDDTDSRGTRVSPAWHADGTKYKYRHRPSYMDNNNRGYINLHPSSLDDTYFEYRVYRNGTWTPWTKVNVHVTNPPPPDLSGVTEPTVRVRFKKEKNYDLLHYVQGTNGNNNVDQVKFAPVPRGLQNFITLNGSGIVNLAPTRTAQVRRHTVKWKAHNPRGGWSTTTKNLYVEVWKGTPPVASDKTLTVYKGNFFDFKLLDSGAISKTDGDAITRYRIWRRGGEPRDNNVRISETLASHGRIWGTPDKVGTFHFRFKAEDFDGQSRLKTFTLIVKDGIPPTTYNVEKTVDKGNYFEWYLDSSTGGVTKTEGNRILEYRYTGSIPGVRLDGRTPPPNGNFRGRPTTLGDYNITFEARDANDWSAPAIFTLHVVQGPPPTTQSGTVTATRGRSYDCGLDLIKGDPCGNAFIQKTRNRIREYEINGTIPGMSIRQSSSIILGTPTTKGNYTLNFRARDDDGWSNPATLDFIVPGEPPVIDVPDFNYTIGRSSPLDIRLADYATATEGDPISYSWSGTLPLGMNWGGEGNYTLSSNIIDNGTFESGNDLNGWTKINGSGSGHIVRENYSTGWAGNAPSDAGSYFLYATGGDVEARQTIDISSYVSGGNVSYDFSAYLGGYGDGDTIRVRLDFKNSSDTVVASYDSGDFKSDKEMTLFSNSASLPNDTTKVTISLIFKRNAGGDTDGYVDNFVLKIKKQSNETNETNARFYGSPTTPGDYTLSVSATDEDGTGIDNFNINVIQPVPPKVHNKTVTLDEGDSLNYNLLANGAVVETDGDTIDKYEVNTTLPAGISFNSNTGSFTGNATSSGNYDIGFRAQDQDDWSAWGIFHIVVNTVLTSNDICFSRLDSNSYGDSDTVNGLNCEDNGTGSYRGGLGCKQSINISNTSDKNLTNVELALDHTPPRQVSYHDHGIDITSLGDDTHQTHFNFGLHNFNKGTKFNLSTLEAYNGKTIYTKKGSVESVNPNNAVFDGNNLYAKYKKDGTLHISKVQQCVFGYDKDLDVDADFKLIYGGPGNAVLGDIAATGDTILYVNNPVNDHYNNSLADANTHYILSDNNFTIGESDPRKRNASSATLNLPSYVKGAHIKWAGLFWQGYVHTPQGSTLSPASITNMHTDATGWNTVKLKTPDGIYHTITADIGRKDMNNSTYHYGMVDNNSSRFFYSAYQEITDLIKNTYSDANNTFTVGNIMTTAGKDYADSLYISHANHDAGQWNVDEYGGGSIVGYFGGWSIVVVYDLIGTPEALDTSISDVYKNVALYNGYDFFMTWGDGDISFEKDVSLSGFRTPGSGTVNSNMIFFGGGADQKEVADTLQIQHGKTATYDNVSNGLNSLGNQFNSTYTKNGNELDTVKTYHHGMDLDIYDVASSMDHNQSSTKIKFGTKKIGTDSAHPNYGHSDQIFPQIIGLSTKLYIPEICYDFDVKIGNYITVSSTEDRIFTASNINSDPLMVKILLKSEQSDFDLIHSKGQIDFNNSVPLSFNVSDSKVSPPSVNAYLPAVSGGEDYITLGEGYTNPLGGTIQPNVVNYAQFAFDFTNDSIFTTQFDIQLSTAIQFSSTSIPIPYILTSAGSSGSFGHIDRCDRNRVYDPVLGSFNVERGDVHGYTNDLATYPLYTQITGRDFNVSLVSYTGAPAYNIETRINTTVELEVINAGSFDNNASTGFDSICEDPSANMGKGALFDFNNISRIPISILDGLPDYQKDVALQNAAFRVWVLTKGDSNGTRTILSYHETDKRKFKAIYNTHYKDNDDNTTHYCRQDCSTNESGTSCYDCLKKYFSQPICSRDNFAIRPESYRVTLKDNNQTDTIIPRYITDNSSSSRVSLAAGYKYRMDVNSTLFNNIGISKGYYHHFKEVDSSNLATLRDGTILEFNTTGTCADTNNTSLDIDMIDGHTLGINYLANKNAGNYNLWLKDANWTKVDQAQYEFKKQFGNCATNDPRAICNDCTVDNFATTPEGSKVGCTLYSDLSGTLYEKIGLSFKPYGFNLSNINLINNPDRAYLFMNDFNNSYYDNLVIHTINMATTFDGNITAVGKDGSVLSNFTKSCVASDVSLTMDRETDPSESALALSTDISGNASPVVLQQYLQYISTTTPIASFNELEGENKTGTIKEIAFEDGGDGNAHIYFHATMKKNERTPINPVSVDYQALNAENLDTSFADMATHTPTGEIIYNENNVTYVYGKVSPEKRLFDNIETNSTLTPIFVDVYCTLNIECQNRYDLNITSHRDNPTGNWYLTGMFTTDEIGTTDLSTILDGGSYANHGVSVNHPLTPIARAVNITDVPFDDIDMPASQKDVNVSVTGPARPSIIKVQYNPVPWLIYDPVNDYYRVKFIGISDWTGVGKAGHVTDINSSKETLYRMNW